jgi:hypothetical protein
MKPILSVTVMSEDEGRTFTISEKLLTELLWKAQKCYAPDFYHWLIGTVYDLKKAQDQIEGNS